MKILILLCLFVGVFAEEECPENAHYNACGSACPLTCENYKNPPKACVLMCVAGCHCDKGYVLTKTGDCVLPEQCNAQKSDTSCLEKPDPGMCRGYFPMFYYDAESGACKEFIYGGCQGNDNRFATESECLSKCGDVKVWKSSSNRCEQPLESGPCMALLHRYGFDKESGKCKKFVYGGCKGNDNNFGTLDECRKTCLSEAALRRPDCDMDADPGLCFGAFPRYYYADGECKKFTYGGCGGNRNNFQSEEECYNKCGALAAPVACGMEKEVGPCMAAFPRYYFNKETGKCEKFIYGGCQGNSNNFEDLEDCEAVCLGK